jgi:hypothetical protein
MIYLLIILLILAHAAAYFLWQRFTRHEVAVNVRDIEADGAADTLRKGYHARRTWVRFWPWLGLVAAGSFPLLWGPHVGLVLLSSLSLGILLAGFFARYFTPWLNVAMKLDYKPEFYASPDSASWPDAAVWKQARQAVAGLRADDRQDYANHLLKQLLTRTWLWCRIAYAVGLLAAIFCLFLHQH